MTLPPFKRPGAARSGNMRAICSSSNRTTERRLVAFLVQNATKGWKLHPPNMPGNPDLIMPARRVAIFVDGCFWHGCPSCGHIPKTNKAYWRAKIARNKKRDRKSTRELKALGYRVVRIWECQLAKRPASCLNRITRR